MVEQPLADPPSRRRGGGRFGGGPHALASGDWRDCLPDAVVCLDGAGRMGEVSSAAVVLFGSTLESLVGQPLSAVVERADAAELERALTVVRSRAVPRGEVGFRVRRPDGTQRRVSASLGLVGDGPGVVAVLRDVHEATLAASAQVEDHRRLQRAVETVGDVLIRCSSDGAVIWASASVATLGWTPALLAGAGATFVDEVDALPWRAALALAATGTTAHVQVRVRTPSRTLRWVAATLTAVRDAHGAVEEFVVVLRDVQDTLEQQQHRSLREERYVALLDRAPVGVLLLGDADRVVWASLRAQELLGMGWADLVGRRFRDVVDLPGSGARGRPASGTRRVRVSRPEGADRHLEVREAPVALPGDVDAMRGVFLLEVEADVSGADEEFGAAPPDVYHAALDAVAVAVLLLAPVRVDGALRDFRVADANAEAVRTFGTDRAHLVGRLVGDAHPWYRELGILNVLDEALATDKASTVVVPRPGGTGASDLVRMAARRCGDGLVVTVEPFELELRDGRRRSSRRQPSSDRRSLTQSSGT